MGEPTIYTLKSRITGKGQKKFSLSPLPKPIKDGFGQVYVIIKSASGGTIDYVGATTARKLSTRINQRTAETYRWLGASDQFIVAAWEIPFNRLASLTSIEMDVAAYYRMITGAWPVDQRGLTAANKSSNLSVKNTWPYAVSIIEDMGQTYNGLSRPLCPLDQEDKDLVRALAIITKNANPG